MPEGAAGGTERNFRSQASQKYADADLNDVCPTQRSEPSFRSAGQSNPALGAEWAQQRMKDGSPTRKPLWGNIGLPAVPIVALFKSGNLLLSVC